MALLDEVSRLRQELDLTRKRISHLERMADEDSMLPIANRRAFVRELTRLISYSERYGTAGSVLYFDLNGMKEINDRYGHPAGDEALRHFARLLVANVRDSDVVGRLGGDEFGVILAQADEAQARDKAGSPGRAGPDPAGDVAGRGAAAVLRRRHPPVLRQAERRRGARARPTPTCTTRSAAITRN